MKTIYLLSALLFVLMISNTTNAQNQSLNNSGTQIRQNTQADTLVFSVYGMDCPGCEIGLEKQVNKISSVRFSDADWLKQELRIVLVQDSTLNSSELEKRVKKANFTLEKEEKN
jgi:copper chaperone CopZ